MARKTETVPAYRLVRSHRKSLAVVVRTDNSVEVRSPLTMPRDRIDLFVRANSGWIERKRAENHARVRLEPVSPEQVRRFADLLPSRIKTLAGQHALPLPRGIRLRDMVSRWGSCSQKGTITLNTRCAALPETLQTYVILHEMCHLRHMNHSRAFWQLLLACLPDTRERRHQLKAYQLVRADREGAST